jgi:hypothetical protein
MTAASVIRERGDGRLLAVRGIGTFAKFGTRLDESTRKIIDHGFDQDGIRPQRQHRPTI